ncbi:ATP-binding cassette domain-containing protein, partial [Listeria monocytogenes]|nr:ATP-binding cassette domain-containing protein [Listeria monocytogenes]
ITAANGLNINIGEGEFVYGVGPSGAGKSTFIKMIYREARATKGKIIVAKFDLINMKNREITYLRRNVGVVFQDYKLLKSKTVYENIDYA